MSYPPLSLSSKLKIHIIIGTCHHHFSKNVSTNALNKNTTNTQDPRRGGCHPNDNNHYHRHHPFDYHSRYGGGGGLVVGGVGGGGE